MMAKNGLPKNIELGVNFMSDPIMPPQEIKRYYELKFRGDDNPLTPDEIQEFNDLQEKIEAMNNYILMEKYYSKSE